MMLNVNVMLIYLINCLSCPSFSFKRHNTTVMHPLSHSLLKSCFMLIAISTLLFLLHYIVLANHIQLSELTDIDI